MQTGPRDHYVRYPFRTCQARLQLNQPKNGIRF
jgi:hypothetical protein